MLKSHPWHRELLRHASLLLLSSLAVQSSSAQTSAATLTGTVNDATGSALPAAVVSIAAGDTAQWRSTITNNQGVYTFTPVPAGRYDLVAAQVGFQPYSRQGILVAPAATDRADILLQPNHDSVLYNGIHLPAAWPPRIELTRQPQPVPYLSSPPPVIDIDTGRQLFVDSFLIEATTLRRTFHHPVPYSGNPVLTYDRPWEQGLGKSMAMPFSDGVWYDPSDHTFKMWYQCSQHQPDTGTADGFYTCYATSADGLHWNKPSLDVVPGTNIVLHVDRDSTLVWLDYREKDPSRRFKLFLSNQDPVSHNWGPSLYESPDGIHWSHPVASNRSTSWISTRSTVFFNPFRNVWVYSLRNRNLHAEPGNFGRLRLYSESKDLAMGLGTLQPVAWTGADDLDLRNPRFPSLEPQLYNLDAVAYESLLVGLFTVWEGPENNVCAKLHIEKRNQVMLGYSRDGFHWDRPERQPFLPATEKEGAWNWGNVQSVGGGFLVVGDKMYFYSSGRKRNDSNWDGDASTGLFTLRRDGFASMDAAQQGALTTRPVLFTGRHLFVNFATFANRGGSLRVEVLDAAGHPIAPFTAHNSIPILRDSTREPVRWKHAIDLSALAGRPVRFRFLVQHGSLYSFWVSSSTSGASMGYVAAGGPGFTGPRDTVGQTLFDHP